MDISNVISVTVPNDLTKISVPHYVPGRKLTSDDLQHERDAALKHLEIVGRAAGIGIIEGLWVAALGSNQLTVSAGTGINGTGHPIVLDNSLTLNLLPTTTQSTTPDEGFGPCKPTLTVNTSKLQDGPYLLAAIPVSRLSKEMTTIERILPTRKIEDCTNLWEEESINFRAIFLGNSLVPEGFKENTSVTLRRNMLAHWAYGTENLLPQLRNPFQNWNSLDYAEFGLARSKFEANGNLTKCDLRLAVFYLQTSGNVQSIQFVDNWAVRRRPYQPSQFPVMPTKSTRAGLAGWSQRLNDQLSAEGEARFSQFQEHLDDLRQTSNLGAVVANQSFRYLPSAGYLPLTASPALCRMIADFVINLFLTEAKKYIANPVRAQIDWTPLPTLNLVVGNYNDFNNRIDTNTDNNLVFAFQINNTITQLNTILENILDAINILTSGKLVYDPISFLNEKNDFSYAQFNDFNDQPRKDMNDRLNMLTAYVNKLPQTCGPTFYPDGDPIQELGNEGKNSQWIDATSFNRLCIIPLNDLINQFVNILNLIGSNPSFATNPFFNQVRKDLSDALRPALLSQPVLASAANGVQIENFFVNNIKDLVFKDRQAIESLLENSWLAPAIDLTVDKNLSLILVYEDVIPYAADELKKIIGGNAFSKAWGNFQQIWCAGVNATFENIIARKSSNRPPLYGLFTQALYPL